MTATDTDLRALVAGCGLHPDDRVRRGALADYLEERGLPGPLARLRSAHSGYAVDLLDGVVVTLADEVMVGGVLTATLTGVPVGAGDDYEATGDERDAARAAARELAACRLAAAAHDDLTDDRMDTLRREGVALTADERNHNGCYDFEMARGCGTVPAAAAARIAKVDDAKGFYVRGPRPGDDWAFVAVAGDEGKTDVLDAAGVAYETVAGWYADETAGRNNEYRHLRAEECSDLVRFDDGQDHWYATQSGVGAALEKLAGWESTYPTDADSLKEREWSCYQAFCDAVRGDSDLGRVATDGTDADELEEAGWVGADETEGAPA